MSDETKRFHIHQGKIDDVDGQIVHGRGVSAKRSLAEIELLYREVGDHDENDIGPQAMAIMFKIAVDTQARDAEVYGNGPFITDRAWTLRVDDIDFKETWLKLRCGCEYLGGLPCCREDRCPLTECCALKETWTSVSYPRERFEEVMSSEGLRPAELQASPSVETVLGVDGSNVSLLANRVIDGSRHFVVPALQVEAAKRWARPKTWHISELKDQPRLVGIRDGQVVAVLCAVKPSDESVGWIETDQTAA